MDVTTVSDEAEDGWRDFRTQHSVNDETTDEWRMCLWTCICNLGDISAVYYWFNSLTPTVAIWLQLNHPVPDRVKPSFVIFDICVLWRSALGVRVARCQKLQMTA